MRMNPGHNRQIRQLWCAAEDYFKLAEKNRKQSEDKDLQTTVEQLVNNRRTAADVKTENAAISTVSSLSLV
jgi:hypothetical protein